MSHRAKLNPFATLKKIICDVDDDAELNLFQMSDFHQSIYTNWSETLNRMASPPLEVIYTWKLCSWK